MLSCALWYNVYIIKVNLNGFNNRVTQLLFLTTVRNPRKHSEKSVFNR